MTGVKICGITTVESLAAAEKYGARFAGFVFYPPSPRALNLETAHMLLTRRSSGIKAVALCVDPDDELLGHITRLPFDMIQLHGSESPARVGDIKSRYGLPVIKAMGLATREDAAQISAYETVADWILCDAKAPPKTAQGINLPGGNGRAFDWTILKNIRFNKPWMLSGGLDAGNVRAALDVLSPDAVDVSSGVESAPGQKDLQKIADFIAAVKN